MTCSTSSRTKFHLRGRVSGDITPLGRIKGKSLTKGSRWGNSFWKNLEILNENSPNNVYFNLKLLQNNLNNFFKIIIYFITIN